MKKIRMFLPLLLLAVAASSQTRMAVLGGLHSASVDAIWNPQPNASHQMSTHLLGAHFGLQADVPFAAHPQLSFQPGLLYTTKGALQEQLLDKTKSPTFLISNKQVLRYIDIPLNLGYRFPLAGKTSLVFGGGPQASLFYSGKMFLTTVDTLGTPVIREQGDLPVGSGNGQFRLLHFGANAYAGLEFGRVFIRAAYSKGLMPYYGNGVHSYRHKSFGAALGIYIGQPNEEEEEETVEKVVVSKKDSDKDGIPDYLDWCPSEPGSKLAMGCPDSDGDGIADKFDQCPNEKGVADAHGCPSVQKL